MTFSLQILIIHPDIFPESRSAAVSIEQIAFKETMN
jgi:hypothetical protein